ncbi:unnamed protein product [marine sediment metagenome]|uniref:Uncharacterized protein n=1 Tax=marine sediment metagenome TaxID=412755 RepID=X1MDP8_9ZZZZ
MANPVSPAIAPIVVKIREKPTTKLREWRNIGRRFPVTRSPNISGPTKLARYTGTKGKTQGDRKDNSPALKATTIDISIFFNAN